MIICETCNSLFGTQTPEDILSRDDLSNEEKIAKLKDRAWDIHELMVADDENMPPNRDDHGDCLSRIEKALISLGCEPVLPNNLHNK